MISFTDNTGQITCQVGQVRASYTAGDTSLKVGKMRNSGRSRKSTHPQNKTPVWLMTAKTQSPRPKDLGDLMGI